MEPRDGTVKQSMVHFPVEDIPRVEVFRIPNDAAP